MEGASEEQLERASSTVSPAPSASATKLFLGGLSWQTTDEKLRTYFTRFGPLEDAVVMMDRNTKLPRGFGFVTFKDPTAAQRAIDSGPHSIDDRLIDCKPSIPQGVQQPAHANRSRKIFVGGLSPETTEEEFRAYFGAYGNVVEAQIMIDPTTNRPRGFGFVTFEDEDSVHRVFAAGTIHILTGKQVEVKAATPKGSGPQGPSAIAARASLAGQMAMQAPGWPGFPAGVRAAGRFSQPGAFAYPHHVAAPAGPSQMPYGMAPVGGYGITPGSYGYAYPVPGSFAGAYPAQYMPGYGGVVPPGGPYPAPYGAYGPPYPAPYPPPGAAPVAVPMYPAGPVPTAARRPARAAGAALVSTTVPVTGAVAGALGAATTLIPAAHPAGPAASIAVRPTRSGTLTTRQSQPQPGTQPLPQAPGQPQQQG